MENQRKRWNLNPSTNAQTTDETKKNRAGNSILPDWKLARPLLTGTGHHRRAPDAAERCTARSGGGVHRQPNRTERKTARTEGNSYRTALGCTYRAEMERGTTSGGSARRRPDASTEGSRDREETDERMATWEFRRSGGQLHSQLKIFDYTNFEFVDLWNKL